MNYRVEVANRRILKTGDGIGTSHSIYGDFREAKRALLNALDLEITGIKADMRAVRAIAEKDLLRDLVDDLVVAEKDLPVEGD